MKIRERQSFAPISLIPGDTIRVTYKDEWGRELRLVEDTVGRTMTVNEAVIFTLDEDELDGLGWEDSIGGMVGRTWAS